MNDLIKISKYHASKNEINFFQKNGYLVIKNVIPLSVINKFKKSFFYLFNNFFDCNIEPDWFNPNISKIINERRENSPLLVKKFYFTVKQLSAYQEMFLNNYLSKVIKKLLNVKEGLLIFSEYQFRFDVPQDNQFLHNWHQDSSYYPQDPNGLNSLVVNITLHKSTEEMGIPNLIIGSHKMNKLNFTDNSGKKSKIMQLNVSEKYIDKSLIVIPESQEGDVIIYHMNLIHKSGYNASKNTRFSALSRVFNPLNNGYKCFYQKTELIT